MITDFQIFEKNWAPKQVPNWFFLVLNETRGSVFDSLMKMEFIGLKGVSDHYEISKKWFDVRGLLLIMRGSEVVKMNDIEPIEYFNPDSLCKNNFKFWRRLTMNEPEWKEFNGQKMDTGFVSGLSAIINDLAYTDIRPSGKGGIKNKVVYDKNGVINYIQKSIYEIENRLEHLYYSGQLRINSLDDFTTEMLKILKEVVKESPCSKKWPWDTHFIKNEDYILNNLKHYELKRILKRSFQYISKVYEKEGEWYITGKSLRVPKGSILYIKESPPEGTPYLDNSSRGMKSEFIDKVINEYGLDQIYDIRRVENHIQMMEILKNEFSNT